MGHERQHHIVSSQIRVDRAQWHPQLMFDILDRSQRRLRLLLLSAQSFGSLADPGRLPLLRPLRTTLCTFQTSHSCCSVANDVRMKFDREDDDALAAVLGASRNPRKVYRTAGECGMVYLYIRNPTKSKQGQRQAFDRMEIVLMIHAIDFVPSPEAWYSASLRGRPSPWPLAPASATPQHTMIS